MERQEALDFVKRHVQNKNLLKHMLACEAVMVALANYFGEDEEKWALAGLLHDIDYDQTKDNPDKHSLIGGEMLEGAGLSHDIVYAVKCHNEVHGLERKGKIDMALFCTDPLTGLIAAGALIKPERNLASIDVEFLKNRFEEKGFARGASRVQIAACRELGLSLEQFFEIGLKAMQGIHKDLGL
ncbi:MAG: phosphohydrolase [Clostridiaceae bacterium BRH_c20a]|nr:MAG: phosphohydrolase [Clostridiaceae bacterium BRH_c20a]